MADAAKKTVVDYDTVLAGLYANGIGAMVGDIVLPETEVPVEKFQANDDTVPALITGDAVVGDVEITVAYVDHATHAVLSALIGSALFIRFTLEGGDTYTYAAIVSKVSPADSAENGALVGKIGFVFSHLAASAAG